MEASPAHPQRHAEASVEELCDEDPRRADLYSAYLYDADVYGAGLCHEELHREEHCDGELCYADLEAVLASQDPVYQRKVLKEWVMQAHKLLVAFNDLQVWQDRLHDHPRRLADADHRNEELGNRLEAVIARCLSDDPTPMPDSFLDEGGVVGAGLGLVAVDQEALLGEMRRHCQLIEHGDDLSDRLTDLETKVADGVDHCAGEKQQEALRECLGAANQLLADVRQVVCDQKALHEKERRYMWARRNGETVCDVVAPAAAVLTKKPPLRMRRYWFKPVDLHAQLRAKLQDMLNIKLERLACMGRILQELREECAEQARQVKEIIETSMGEEECCHEEFTHCWPGASVHERRDMATSGATVLPPGITDAELRHELTPLLDVLEQTRNQIVELKKLPAEHQGTSAGRELYHQLGRTLDEIAELIKLPILGSPEHGVHCTDVLYEAAADMHLLLRDNERRHAAWYEAAQNNEDPMAAWLGACARG